MLYEKPVKDSWKIHEEVDCQVLHLKISRIALLKAYDICQGKIKIIGVGGISNGKDAFEKISLGANVLQLYTSLVYKGPDIVEILEDLSNKIKKRFKKYKQFSWEKYKI